MKSIVLGSINMDLVTIVDKKPKDGETIIGKGFFSSFGGKGANQAISIAKLGNQVKFLGKVGNDSFGKDLLKNLEINKIDISKIEKIEGTSGLATITLDKNGENSIVVIPGANGFVDKKYIERVKDEIISSDLLLCQLEIPLETVKYAFEIAKKHNVTTLLNPAPCYGKIDDILSLTDILIANETEIELLMGIDLENINDLREKSKKLFDLGIKDLIVTLGKKGAIYTNGEKTFKIEAYKVEVVDTTAAGDSFIGGFIHNLKDGVEAGIKTGMITGAIAVGRRGASDSFATIEEVEKFNEKN